VEQYLIIIIFLFKGVETLLSEIRISLGGSALFAINNAVRLSLRVATRKTSFINEMKTSKMKKKAIVLSLGLAAMMLLATNLNAQSKSGGLLGRGFQAEQAEGGLFRGIGDPVEISDGGGITNYGIGEEVPLGSGMAILLAAGLGYVALKKKEDEQ
jgi:hypothetical protein